MRNVEAEHAEHDKHLRSENDGHLPDIPQYEYMNRRVKPYPWGMNSLFYNPHVSLLLLSSTSDPHFFQVNKDLEQD